jgi:hypothetical protein
MLLEQIDRIRLIEKLVSQCWNIGFAGWGSGHRKSSKIIMQILKAIMNTEELTVGSTSADLIPPRFKNLFPYQTVAELRAAQITADDLEKVSAKRTANANLVVDVVRKMFEKGFRSDIDSVESILSNAIYHSNPSHYISKDDIETLKQAEIIKFDFSGFLCKARLKLMKILSQETNFTPAQIIHAATSQTEKHVDLMAERVLSTKEKIEVDFDRLKWRNITAQDAIADIQNIGNNFGSRYEHIRSFTQVISQGFDFKIVAALADKLAPVLDKKFADFKALPVEPVKEPEIHVKTPEEIAADQQAIENGIMTLVTHFNLEKADAIEAVNRIPINYVRSLWNIKINIMPRFEKALVELTEKFEGNVQMVEDIVRLEQLVWANATEAWNKYHIPVQRMKYGLNPVSVISNDQSDALLTIDKDLAPALIKPLRNNLTQQYKLNHPGKEVLTGRDVNKFKEYAFISKWKTVPEFMFNNTGIEVLNSTVNAEPEFIEPNVENFNATENDDSVRPITSGDLLLGLDLLMITFLIGYLCYLYGKFNRKGYFIETNHAKPKVEYAIIEDLSGGEEKGHFRRV